MESIVCLRSALNIILPSKSPAQLLSFPHHPARHLAILSHLSIPRWRPRPHRRVSCSSHVPPPPPPLPQTSPKKDDLVDRKKDRVGGQNGPRAAAAAGAAVIVACALGGIYMSRGPAIAASPVAQTSQFPQTGNNKTIVEKTRDEVFEILFKKDRSTMDRGQRKSTWFGGEERYEASFPLISLLLERRDYHEAKAVLCEKIMKVASKSDARVPLLMTVVNMMLAVEAMLLPNTTIDDVDKLIDSARFSWKKYRDLEKEGFVSEPVVDSKA